MQSLSLSLHHLEGLVSHFVTEQPCSGSSLHAQRHAHPNVHPCDCHSTQCMLSHMWLDTCTHTLVHMHLRIHARVHSATVQLLNSLQQTALSNPAAVCKGAEDVSQVHKSFFLSSFPCPQVMLMTSFIPSPRGILMATFPLTLPPGSSAPACLLIMSPRQSSFWMSRPEVVHLLPIATHV